MGFTVPVHRKRGQGLSRGGEQHNNAYLGQQPTPAEWLRQQPCPIPYAAPMGNKENTVLMEGMHFGQGPTNVAQPLHHPQIALVDRHTPYSSGQMMALPGHSPPPPFAGPGSPPKSLNGYPEPQPIFPLYGPQPRPMPPPSPQHFPPRFSQAPQMSQATASMYPQNDSRLPPPPHKRPGSSMSISSMLGTEPEKPQDPYYNRRTTAHPQSAHGPSMSLGALMSPPQYSSRSAEYSYKPRSQTPDKVADSLTTRPYRSGSGSLLQRPAQIYDLSTNHDSRAQVQKYGEQSASPRSEYPAPRDEAAERARRTSISGILQRPESEPQQPSSNGSVAQNGGLFQRSASTNGEVFGMSKAASVQDRPAPPSSYDTRPPPFSNAVRPAAPTSTPRETGKSVEKREAQSMSPDLRRVQPSSNEPRSLASILNLTSENGPGSQSMTRQDSVQSQSDRSAFGDRYRTRAFSPFAGSVASQTMSITSVPTEDQARKGSDELSQHRTILGLATESKRGRYSPVPQAVQGAQAQTPTPDAGIKTEHGRVFAGLGGGLGTSSGPNTTRPGLAPSPFRSSEGGARLSEENLMKISRSTSGVPKRARKYDEEVRAESDTGAAKKTARGTKRSKYGHSYRLDLDDNPRRSTPLSGLHEIRRAGTPTNATSQPQQMHHHHHLQRQTSAAERTPLFKPKKTIRISSVIASAKRLPRRHVGSFKYDPEVDGADVSKPGDEKFDVSIRPNLLPSFVEAEKVNCTYTVRVPKLWLQDRERRMICKESYLWGSGIYTDDSDVVAAAMHSGFLKSTTPDAVDGVLLERVISEQNPKIEGLVNVPEKPAEPDAGKDALITLLVLPTLDRYVGSSRFGICSRTWPENATKTQHDGVSFAVMKVEFVAGGVEGRRMGRTGVSKRARIKVELEARKRGEEMRKEMIEKMKLKGKQKSQVGKRNSAFAKTSVGVSKATTQKPMVEVRKDVPPLDVGQTPGEWLRQLEVSAVD